MPDAGTGWAAYDTVEKHHTDNKAAHSMFDERIRSLETDRATVAQKLEHINAALDRIEETVTSQRPQPIKPWQVIGAAMPFLLLFAGWVWAAARYPEREEFRVLQGQYEELRIQLLMLRHSSDDVTQRVKMLEHQ
jgi:prefoldin subunit 5